MKPLLRMAGVHTQQSIAESKPTRLNPIRRTHLWTHKERIDLFSTNASVGEAAGKTLKLVSHCPRAIGSSGGRTLPSPQSPGRARVVNVHLEHCTTRSLASRS